MTISDRSRKLLWGRSGSRCAKCRRELIKPGTPVDDDSIIGDECHIVSAAPNGPRYDPDFRGDHVDSYSNLLLLCKVDHKLIDDQESKYTADYLRDLKAKHEKWVSKQLDSVGSSARPVRIRRIPENVPKSLPRIKSGKEVLDIVTDAYAFASGYDDLRNETEDELVACFLQDAQDYGELGFEFVRDRMRAARFLDEHIRELERAGFWIFGCRERQVFEGGIGPATDWPVAHIRVLRNNNPDIITKTDQVKEG